MAITKEQIEAEIRELTAEVDRMVSGVHEVFAKAAKLRAQIEHFQKLLDLRIQSADHSETVSFIFLGFAPREDDALGALCAVTWFGPASVPTDVRITVKRDWQRLLPIDASKYFSELLDDWKQRAETESGAILSQIGELSVGPIRTMDQGAVHKDRIAHLLYQRLGDIIQFPSTSPQTPGSVTMRGGGWHSNI